MASMSRWLVGSSIMRNSASVASTSAIATRFTSPPESSRIFCSGRNENSVRRRTMRLSYSKCPVSSRHSVNLPLPESICSSRVASGSNPYSCSRKAMRMSLRNLICPPESDLSLPARMRIREVFPLPFGAIRAILSPSLTLNPIWSKSTFGPYDLEMFSIWRYDAISTS